MPIYPTPDEYGNGYVPAGSALQEPAGFDVSLPAGTNPEPPQQQPSVWGLRFVRITCWLGCFVRQNNSNQHKVITRILIRMKFMVMSNGDLLSQILSRQRKPHGLKVKLTTKMKIVGCWGGGRRRYSGEYCRRSYRPCYHCLDVHPRHSGYSCSAYRFTGCDRCRRYCVERSRT